MRSAKFVGCIALLLVAVMAGRADARLFAYGFGAECCVDKYHYFVCHTSHAVGRDMCNYRGYSLPRYADSGIYGLYGCTWSPRPGVSAGYSCCNARDGCRWGLTGPGYGKFGVHDFLFRYPHAVSVPDGYSRVRLSVGYGSTGHLYDMLFDMPARCDYFDQHCRGHHRHQAGCHSCEVVGEPSCSPDPTMQYETPTMIAPAKQPADAIPHYKIMPVPAARQ